MDCKAEGGFFDYMFNPNCGLDIYETCSKEVWVNCKISQAKLGMLGGLLIVIIVASLFFVFGTTTQKVVAGIISAILVIGIGIGTFYWAGQMASVEWDRFEKEIEGTMKNFNLNRTDAIKMLRDEKEKNKDRAVQQNIANAQQNVATGIWANVLSNLIKKN